MCTTHTLCEGSFYSLQSADESRREGWRIASLVPCISLTYANLNMRIVCWFVHVERSGWNAAGKHAVEFNKIDRRPWGRKDGRGRVERTGPRSRIAMWPGHSRPSPPVVIRASSPRRTRNMSGGRDGPRGCWSSGRCNRKSEWNVSAKEKGNL